MLPLATVVALAGGWSVSPIGRIDLSARPRGAAAQAPSEDPCRFATADEVGKAFGRAFKSAKLADVCEYRAENGERVVMKIATGAEGTILRYAKAGAAKGDKAVERVVTSAGEAYFDSTVPVFIGRAGNREVQVETTIQPTPRDAMIAVGKVIMESLARK